MTASEILAKHHSDGNRLCYARSLGPITLRHSGGNVEARDLRCTEKLDHDGEHRDGNCCWTPHFFPHHMAGPPNPQHHDWERCVECGREWPCDVRILADALGQP